MVKEITLLGQRFWNAEPSFFAHNVGSKLISEVYFLGPTRQENFDRSNGVQYYLGIPSVYN